MAQSSTDMEWEGEKLSALLEERGPNNSTAGLLLLLLLRCEEDLGDGYYKERGGRGQLIVLLANGKKTGNGTSSCNPNAQLPTASQCFAGRRPPFYLTVTRLALVTPDLKSDELLLGLFIANGGRY